jgi:hypothetical protein
VKCIVIQVNEPDAKSAKTEVKPFSSDLRISGLQNR